MSSRTLGQRLFDDLAMMLNFSWNRRQEWMIYGAKARFCPSCMAPPNVPCRNLSDMKRNKTFNEARLTKYPHEDRIDYALIIQGMMTRELISKEIGEARIAALLVEQNEPK